jgi:hypothetical protein
VKTGAPEGVSCTMCISGALAERYFSRRVAISLRVDVTLEVFSWPSAYLAGQYGLLELI